MGRDKALLEVEGEAMVLRVANALRAAGCAPVFAVGGDRAGIEALGIEFVADQHPGEGPLGGVITALDTCQSPAVVVVACDLPFLTADTVRSLIVRHRGALATVATTDRVQPLCAVWSRSALAQARDVFSTGERRLATVLHDVIATQVRVNPQDLANVNAPSDLPQ